MLDIPTTIDLLTRGGLLTALLIALLGGMKGWYIWGYQHKEILKAEQESNIALLKLKDEQLAEMKEDRDYWRNQARQTLRASERTVNVIERNSA